MLSPLIGIIASSGVAAATSSYESIATVTVGSGGASSVTFSSIPATYTHLQLRYLSRSTAASTEPDIHLTFNSDTGSNYTAHQLYGDGSSAGSNYYGTIPRANMIIGVNTGALATASIFGGGVIDVLDYANTNKYKTVRSLNGDDRNGSGTIVLRSGAWLSTTAISSIEIYTSSNFAQYSSFALYGIKGA